jgi:hypothetical protein
MEITFYYKNGGTLWPSPVILNKILIRLKKQINNFIGENNSLNGYVKKLLMTSPYSI